MTARPAPSPAAHPARSPLPPKAGIGLRFPHQRLVAETRPEIPWFEVHTENYFGGGTRLRFLESIRGDYPLSLHGTALSPGSAEGIQRAHLTRVAEAIARLEPALVSEHLSFSTVDGIYLADLLPLPLTEEALDLVCRNVEQLQDALKHRILMENPSTYLRFRHSTIPEWEFLAALAARTGCGILCDVNNIYVSAFNHGFDAVEFLNGIPVERVRQIHLAGHSHCGTHIIDTHDADIVDPVWELYATALRRFGEVATMIERDDHIPPLLDLVTELGHAREIAARTLPSRAAA